MEDTHLCYEWELLILKEDEYCDELLSILKEFSLPYGIAVWFHQHQTITI